MFRDGNNIYNTEAYGNNRKQSIHSKTTIRPLKNSEIEKDLKDKIALCKLQLKHGKDMSPDRKNDLQEKIRILERRKASLTSNQTRKIRKSYKRIHRNKIREYTLSQIEMIKSCGGRFITAEDIANQLQVKTSTVKQVFQQLNIEGVLMQPEHHIPHDSNRDPMCNGMYSGWSSDIYFFRNKEEEKKMIM